MTDELTIEGAKKGLLKEVAEHFGTDVGADDGVAEIRKNLKADGITDENVVQFVELKKLAEEENAAAEEKKADDPDEETILIKMTRRNPSMSIRGHKFTQRHPYQLVPVKDAEFIVQSFTGFSVALPSEVEGYYN